jgi:succinoglycan biosynthesis protein ExoA
MAKRPHQWALRRIRSISVIAPMFNEADHIGTFVADVAGQDFAGDVELLVADGRSNDGSVALLETACREADLRLTVIDNPDRWVSPGLNACIRIARGDLIVRMDCHTGYPPDYLRLCASAAEETGAWNIGGLVIPIGHTTMERAVACAMDSPFGGVHWTRHASSPERVEIDMVHCGAYLPEGLERAGLFDESLVRNQDDDLAFRLRKAGGSIILDPAIRSHYIPRGSLKRVFRQYYEYGFWKVVLMLKHRNIISPRALAPPLFLATLAALVVAAPLSGIARALLLAEVGLYIALALIFGVATIRAHRERWSLLPRVLLVFPTFHLAYGIGDAASWLHVGQRLLRGKLFHGLARSA